MVVRNSFPVRIMVDGERYVGRGSTDGDWVRVEVGGAAKSERCNGVPPKLLAEILMTQVVRKVNRPNS